MNTRGDRRAAWQFFGRLQAESYLHAARKRRIERQGRLVWVLIVLVALAPEIIAVGRLLLK